MLSRRESDPGGKISVLREGLHRGRKGLVIAASGGLDLRPGSSLTCSARCRWFPLLRGADRHPSRQFLPLKTLQSASQMQVGRKVAHCLQAAQSSVAVNKPSETGRHDWTGGCDDGLCFGNERRKSIDLFGCAVGLSRSRVR